MWLEARKKQQKAMELGYDEAFLKEKFFNSDISETFDMIVIESAVHNER